MLLKYKSRSFHGSLSPSSSLFHSPKFTMAFTMDSGSALLSPMGAGLFLVSIVAYTGYVCYHAFLGVLADLPGPFTARFTNFWRVKSAASGKAPAKFQNLHRKYGSVVRVGPIHVSVSDPAQIPVIYGISSKFTKVSAINMPDVTTDQF